MADSIKINLEVADAAAAKALQDLINKSDVATKNFKVFGQAGKNAFDQIGASLGKTLGIYDLFVGNLAANLATKAFETLTGSASAFFNTIVDEAANSEQAITNLNVALRSAGLYSSETSKDFQDFAGELQKVTKYSDEAVLSSVSLFASITNLDKNGIKKATNAAADLAATLNIDLGTATEMIAKAVNGNVVAFQKQGITIEKAETTSQRLTNTLKALQTQQGAAEAQALTYAGATAKAANQQSELYEALGKLITQSPTTIALLNAKAKVFETLAGFVSTNTDKIRELGVQLVTSIIPGGDIIAGFVLHWRDLKLSIYQAGAATLEYASKAAGLFSEDKAKALEKEAAAWRFKAEEITASIAREQRAKQDADKADEAARAKKEADEKANTARIYGSRLELAVANAQQLAEIEIQSNDNIRQIRGAFGEEELLTRQQHERELLQLQIDTELARANLENDSQARKEALEKVYYKASIDRAKLNSKQKEELAKHDVDVQRDTLQLFASLANSNNKTLAAIGKAAAITQLAIKTPEAVGNSYAFGTKVGGPILGSVFAGIAAAAMAAQTAQVLGVQFASGGIVPGTSFTGDQIQTRLNSGEMVLNRGQQTNLFDMLNGRTQASSGITREEVATMIAEVANRPVVVQIDGKEVFAVVRDQVRAGRNFN